MKIIENTIAYKCEFCGRTSLNRGNMVSHERACGVLEHNLKTMHELNRKSKLPIEITEEHIKIINRFMEEKKTIKEWKETDERKGEILDEIAELGEKISDLIEEYGGDIIIEIDQYEVLLRNSGDILYRK